MKNIYSVAIISILATILAVGFYLPILNEIHNLGIQDWDQNFAWSEVTRLSILRYRQFPFWNPYQCGGLVHFANPQIGILSIQTLFTLVFGTVVGIKISVVLNSMIGFIGFYLLSMQYGLSKKASVVASILFSFNGAVSSALSTGMIPFTGLAYIPYVLYFYNKGVYSFRWTLVSALVYALSYYHGYHIPLLFSVFISIQTIARCIYNRSLMHGIQFALFSLFFLVLSAPKLLLSLQLISVTPSYIPDLSGYRPDHLLHFLFSGRQSLYGTGGMIHGYTWGTDENSLYLGILPGIFFLFFFYKNNVAVRKRTILLATGICMTLLMLGSLYTYSPYAWLRELPIFSSFRVAQRFRFVFLIPFALIAGLGFDRFIIVFSNRNLRRIVSVCFIAIIYADLTYFGFTKFLHASLIIHDTVPYSDDTRFSQRNNETDGNDISYSINRIPKNLEGSKNFSPWSRDFQNIRDNTGNLNCYTAPVALSTVSSSSSEWYNGEWYTKYKSFEITQNYWSPNTMSYTMKHVQFQKKYDVLIINQNYYPGWFVEIDGNTNPVLNYEGLIAAEIHSTMKHVTFKFMPYRWMIMKFIQLFDTSPGDFSASFRTV